ncbi:MAG TPA: glycosyltransferase [Deltaproteobacteria bacterium]|nr:glycosyltransferase [Deltaproteobacteria bacterium]
MAEKTRPPAKILHIISTLDTGGAEQNLFRLVSTLDRGSFTSEVVCMRSPGPVAARITASGVPVRPLHMRPGVPSPLGVMRLWSTAGRFRPDIVQCWMYHANLMGLCLFMPGRTVWNIRCSDMDLARYGGAYRFAVRAGAALSGIPRAVIVNSDAGRKAHEAIGYRPRRWVTIRNGFDTELFRPDASARSAVRAELGIDEHALVIGLVGRLDPMKDHATFFQAAAMFLETYKDATFVLAGRAVTADNPALTALIPASAPRAAFRLLGERDDVQRVLACMDIAAGSSVYGEGFPNALAEAMACGVPCVATDVGDTSLLVGDTGIVVERGSSQALCRGLETLARMGPDQRRRLGARARTRVETLFTQKNTTAAYEDLYRKILTSSRS